jgi:hypothetical protein
VTRMASRALRNRIVGLEHTGSENMSGEVPENWPCRQGGCVEGEEPVVAVEGLD